MQHAILLILFIFHRCPLSIASRPSEQHLGFGLDDAFRPDALPEGFDGRTADAIDCATCGGTQSEPSIAPNPEMRNGLFLGEVTREENGLEAVMDAKSSVEKQRRQVPPYYNADGLASEPASNAQPPTPGNDPDQQARNSLVCRLKTGSGCNLTQCKAAGGACAVVDLSNGRKGCRKTRALENGIQKNKRFSRLPSCRGCRCQPEHPWKELTEEDCLMLGKSPQDCPKNQAQRCYNAGARCVVGENKNGAICTRRDTENNAHLQGIQLTNPWKTEACQGCFCTKQRHNKGHGWNNVELSKSRPPTGLTALWSAAGALSPVPPRKRKKSSPG